MGTLEYKSFLGSPLAAYCKISELAPGAEAERIIDLLLLLDTFEDALWLNDSCVGHELAFIVNGPTIHSNLHQGLRTRADSTCARSADIPAGLGGCARVSGRQVPDFRPRIGGFQAPVSARHFRISVSACRRPV